MNNLHNDKSDVSVKETKSFSEGAGKFMASLGKEIDEHDIGGKIANAGAFAVKANTIYKIVSGIIAGIIVIIIAVVMLISLIN